MAVSKQPSKLTSFAPTNSLKMIVGEPTLASGFTELALPILVVLSATVIIFIESDSAIPQVMLTIGIFFLVLLTLATRPLHAGTATLILAGVAAVGFTGRPNFIAFAILPSLVYLIEGIELRKVMRNYTIFGCVAFITILSLNKLFGFNSEFDILMWRPQIQMSILRSSFGFTHPNQATMFWIAIVSAFVFLMRFKFRRLAIISLALISFVLFEATDSRTTGYLILILLVTTWILRARLNRPLPALLKKLLVILPLLLFSLSIAFPLWFRDGAINALLSGRLAISAQYLSTHSVISLFGYEELESSMFDSGYLHMLLTKGILATIFYLLYFTFRLAKTQSISWSTATISIVFMVAALFETTLLNFMLLIPLIAGLEMDRRISQQMEVPAAHAFQNSPHQESFLLTS